MLGRVWVVAVALVAGCTTTFSGTALQPNPLAHSTETLRTSEKITIVTSQMGLNMPKAPQPGESGSLNSAPAHSTRFPFLNQASFTLVSRDRLRFHVQVDHSWEEWADLNTWEVELTDDQGRRWRPEALEHVRKHLMTKMWDQETRTQMCNHMGRSVTGDCYEVIGYYEDGYRDRQTLGNISVFRGNGDFVFYQRDLFTPHVRWMRLTLKRPGQAFEFLWEFEDALASN